MRADLRDAHRLLGEEVAGVGTPERLDEGAEVERGPVVAVLRAEDEDRTALPVGEERLALHRLDQHLQRQILVGLRLRQEGVLPGGPARDVRLLPDGVEALDPVVLVVDALDVDVCRPASTTACRATCS